MNIRKLLCPIGLFMATTLGTYAAPIVFTPGANISGDSDVTTIGTLVAAYNMGATGVSPTTVNGVTFAAFAYTGSNPTTVGNYSIQETVPAAGLTAANTGYGSASAPFSSLSASYKTFLSSGIASGIQEDLVLTLGGLTVGQAYVLEIWSNFSTLTLPIRGGTMTVQSPDGGVSTTLNQNVTGTEGGLGQYTLGTFVATATSQSVTMTGGTGLPLINGFELRAVPEPGSLALFATFGAGLLALHRRRRRS